MCSSEVQTNDVGTEVAEQGEVDANAKGSEELEALAEEVDEEDFRANYMPEGRESEVVIRFISAPGDSRENVNETEDIGKAFDTVENMIKGVFPQLLNCKDGKVGQAKNCIHEIHLKPGTIPVKQSICATS